MSVRSIEKEMFDFLEFKLERNGLAQKAIDEKDPRTLLYCAAQACVGIREVGHNKGKYIELIQKTIGGAEREPYCMAGVQTWIAYVEQKLGIKSPIYASEHCMTVWRNTPTKQRVKTSPLLAAIIIWNREGSDRGHTGIIIESKYRQSFSAIEANTDGDGSREGDGIYVKSRSWYRNGSLKVMGFLKPF